MSKTKDKTPLERFEALAKKLIAVPKEEADRVTIETTARRKSKKDRA